jgi:hypothetical protein
VGWGQPTASVRHCVATATICLGSFTGYEETVSLPEMLLGSELTSQSTVQAIPRIQSASINLGWEVPNLELSYQLEPGEISATMETLAEHTAWLVDRFVRSTSIARNAFTPRSNRSAPCTRRKSACASLMWSLLRKRPRSGPRRFSMYYPATVFGEVALTDGIDELIRGEQEFELMYDSSTQ